MSEEFERLKEALRKPATPEAMREAASAFKKYEEAKRAKGRPTSRPTLVSLGFGKNYPTSIELKDIPGELERNPAFFKFLSEVVEAD